MNKINSVEDLQDLYANQKQSKTIKIFQNNIIIKLIISNRSSSLVFGPHAKAVPPARFLITSALILSQHSFSTSNTHSFIYSIQACTCMFPVFFGQTILVSLTVGSTRKNRGPRRTWPTWSKGKLEIFIFSYTRCFYKTKKKVWNETYFFEDTVRSNAIEISELEKKWHPSEQQQMKVNIVPVQKQVIVMEW